MNTATIASLQKGYAALRERADTPDNSSLRAFNTSNSMLQQELGSFKEQLFEVTELPGGEPILKAEYELLLQLARLNRVREQAVLERVKKVENGRVAALHAKDCCLKDISPLAGLRGLRELDLTQNEITDCRSLSGLTGLQVLNLCANQVMDIECLSGLTGLRFLELGNNRITGIKPLSEMTLLQDLRLWENEIVSINPLAGLANLQGLSLSSNDITEIECLTGLKNLKWVSVANNPLYRESRYILEELLARGVNCNPDECRP